MYIKDSINMKDSIYTYRTGCLSSSAVCYPGSYLRCLLTSPSWVVCKRTRDSGFTGGILRFTQMNPNESQMNLNEPKLIQNEHKWTPIVPEEPNCNQMNLNETLMNPKWTQMKPSNHRWSWKSQNVTKWSQINPIIPRWDQMSQNVTKWSQVKPKWIQKLTHMSQNEHK